MNGDASGGGGAGDGGARPPWAGPAGQGRPWLGAGAVVVWSGVTAGASGHLEHGSALSHSTHSMNAHGREYRHITSRA